MLKKILLCVITLILIFPITTCNRISPKFDSDEMRNICNLAVMDCYFHNIAKLHKPAENLMCKEKTIWFEYTAKVKFGIDASLIEVDVYKNLVTICLPQARALQNPNIIDDTIKPYSSVDGLIRTKITPEERLLAQEAANINMVKQLNENKSLVQKAETRIKIILSNYINQIGDFSGVEYKIVWERI